MDPLAALSISILVLFAIFYGSLQCFRRDWVAAFLMFIFFFPGLMIWAFIEIVISLVVLMIWMISSMI